MHQLKSSYLMEGLYMKDARTRYSCDIFPFFLFQNLTFLHINISSHHYEYPSPILLGVSNKLSHSLSLPFCQKTTSCTARSCPFNNTFLKILSYYTHLKRICLCLLRKLYRPWYNAGRLRPHCLGASC